MTSTFKFLITLCSLEIYISIRKQKGGIFGLVGC